MLHSPLPGAVFGSSPLLGLAVQALSVLALITGFIVLTTWFSRRGVTFASAWLAAILTAFMIGVALDLGTVAFSFETSRLGAFRLMYDGARQTIFAVFAGWIPALIASGGTQAKAADPVAHRTPRVALVTFLACLIALPLVAEASRSATQQSLREERAVAEAAADPDGIALPDPEGTGEPVPSIAPDAVALPTNACTAETTSIAAGNPDAALGHRGQILTIVNIDEANPCALNGYPDVAFGDQNGHLLEVTIEHGGSYMAKDPGPSEIVLQPGEAAYASVSWDANSMHGQLIAVEEWVALAPGQTRSKWDHRRLDIIPGATVTLSAWSPQSPAAAQ